MIQTTPAGIRMLNQSHVEHSDGWLDWIVPSVAVVLVACIIEFGL